MLAAGLVPDIEILKVGHHGSSSSSSAQFLDAAKPLLAIYMAGEGNSYGHPHQETLIALTDIDALYQGTDMYGTIVITTTGEEPFSVQPPYSAEIKAPANFIVTNYLFYGLLELY